MGTAECIIYAYDLSTVPSVLPAFANAKDLIVMDEVNIFLTVQSSFSGCDDTSGSKYDKFSEVW